MKPLRLAQVEVLGAVPSLPTEPVPLGSALGLALAQPVFAPHPVPPFANSAMDGYALRAADVTAPPVVLPVLEDVPAGKVAAKRVAPGTAIRIMTGAPIPEGADTVVRVEDTERLDGSVRVLVSPPPGASIRPAGGDVPAASLVFAAGVRLTAAHIGVLANIGVVPVVRRRPRVAVMSTGDELVPPDTASLRPGQIRDSNRPMVIALLTELGAEVVDLGIVGDDAAALRSALKEAAAKADAVISSGGVSMGDYDLVKSVLSETGQVEFWQVAMQPAKPFAFGHLGGKPLFGLPGNPVSVMVAFEQFARPALLHMMGAEHLFRPVVPGRMAEAVSTDPAKTVFLRVRTRLEDGVRVATLSGGQSSNVLSAVAAGDAFGVIPEGTAEVPAGGGVDLEMFRWPEERTAAEVLG